MRRFVTFVLVPLLVGVICLLIGLNLRTQVTTKNLSGLSTSKLQDEKIRQEIQQLQLSNTENNAILHNLLAWAPFVTALAAIATVGVTLWKQASDLETARSQLEEEHRKTRTANEEEALRRFDTNLSNVIANLGSGSEVLRVNAAAALATYVKPRYSAFYTDLLIVLTSNLRLQPTEPVARVLRDDLERLLRLIFGDTRDRAEGLPTELDLGRASLRRFDISGINFGKVVIDVAFADLSEARLVDAQLFRLRGREVNLENSYCSRALLGEARLNGLRARGAVMHEINLVSATLKDADLRDVKLQGAFMQEAHLEGAQLSGANFTGANLANTYFRGASFDKSALRTIARGAKRWRDNRNFDDSVRRALLDLGNDSK
jgi:uncharacterized protein YjbI with pentapeptide repeats